jgi:hypothetical protein
VTKTASASPGSPALAWEERNGSRDRARMVAFKARTQADSHNSICWVPVAGGA